MNKRTTIYYLLLLVFICALSAGCVEKYDFNVQNEQTGIVIESYISNHSYQDTRQYPSDGRYFEVRLATLSDVTNTLDEAISDAVVTLQSSTGNAWSYSELTDNPGTYRLRDESFSARSGRTYQLNVTLPTGEQITSSWEQMPSGSTNLGEISSYEKTKEKFVYFKPDERRLEIQPGLQLQVLVPENDTEAPKYYRWSYEPLWIFEAPNVLDNHPNKRCWVRSDYYLNSYTLQIDQIGEYTQDLFFIRTKANNRMFHYFSALVTQTEISERYYYFWKDLDAQSKKGGLFDQPPFSLPTNFTSTNSDLIINGFFGVVTENATRWTFDKFKLSYDLEDISFNICNGGSTGVEPGPECFDCRRYPYSGSVNYPPDWW